jgi:hypothetical protein
MRITSRVGSLVMPRIRTETGRKVQRVVERSLGHRQGEVERCVDARVPREDYRAWIAARLPSPYPAPQRKDEDGDLITLNFDRESVESRFPNFGAAKRAAELRMKEYYRRQNEGDFSNKTSR